MCTISRECVPVCAAFVLWAKHELQYFVSVFSGQVFVTKYNLSAVAECVTEAMCYCSQVCLSVCWFAASRRLCATVARSVCLSVCLLVSEHSSLATLIFSSRVCHSVSLSAFSELNILETSPDSGMVPIDSL